MDSDALIYIQNVEAVDGQPLEQNVITSINNFVTGCKADGIWDAIKSSCILAGARSLDGALIPLKGTAPTKIGFVNSDYNRALGLKGNGSSKYLNSNRKDNDDPLGNQHLTIFHTDPSAYNGSWQTLLGAKDSLTNNGSSLKLASASNKAGKSRNSSSIQSSGGGLTGFIGISRVNSLSVSWKAGSNSLITFTDGNTIADESLDKNIFVFAENLNSPTPHEYTFGRIAFYSIGEGLDLDLMSNRVNTLMNSISTISIFTATSAFNTSNQLVSSVVGNIPNNWVRTTNYPNRRDVGSVTFANDGSINSIGEYAFQLNEISSIDIPAGVTSVGAHAFDYNFLSSLTLPNTLISIGEWAFEINDLKSVVIPNSVTTIGRTAFSWNQLSAVKLPDNLTVISNSLLSNNKLSAINIPNSVVTIDDYAFYNNQLSGVNIPNSVTTINRSAFQNNNISSLTLGNNLQFLGSYAFWGNKISSLTLPSSLTVIETGAFTLNSITDISIPNTVTSLGNGAFSINQLSAASLPNNITRIPNTCFYFNKLSAFNIPSSVTSMGNMALDNNQLKEIIIPSSVTSIEKSVFASNTTLASVSCYTTRTAFQNTTPGDGAFANTASPLIIHVRYLDNTWTAGSNQSFQDNNNVTVIKDLDIPTTIAYDTSNQIVSGVAGNIPNNWVQNKNIASVIFNEDNNRTSIGSSSFVLNKLSAVDIPNNITSIGPAAFASNELLTVKLPNNILDLATSIFENNKLSAVNIPNSVINIGAFAFSNNQLSAVDISNTVTSIGQGAFASNQLSAINIPSGLQTIETSTFANNKLTELTIPEGILTIGTAAFEQNRLTSISLPNSLTSLGTLAFNNNLLSYVTIPSNITSLQNYVFSTNRLSAVNIPSSITSIGTGTFRTNLLSAVNIPSSITSIGYLAFADNTNLSQVSCFTTRNAFIGNNAFEGTSSPLTIFVRTLDSTWTAGPGQSFQGNNNVTVVRNLEIVSTSAFNTSNQLVSSVQLDIPDYWVDNKGIASVIFANDNTITSIGVRAFKDNFLSAVNIPNSVKFIKAGAFWGNQLSAVNIPNSVTTIEQNVFDENSLSSVTLGNSLTSIGFYAFARNQITSVLIPNSLTFIGEGAFISNQLTSITIPDSVTTIQELAFTHNTALSTVNCYTTQTAFVNSPDHFYDTADPLIIHVRYNDNTWTEGTGLSILGNNNVTVIKDLEISSGPGSTALSFYPPYKDEFEFDIDIDKILDAFY